MYVKFIFLKKNTFSFFQAKEQFIHLGYTYEIYRLFGSTLNLELKEKRSIEIDSNPVLFWL